MLTFSDKKSGKRPSVDTNQPDIVINLHISNSKVTVSLDSSVIPLFKRGYRIAHGDASLNEVLAAGLIKLADWDKNMTLTDPMCGSGTIPIEAAMIAANIPGGYYRNSFGFMNWKDFDSKLFKLVKDEEDSKIDKSLIKVVGSDISEMAVKSTLDNLNNAGLSDYVDVKIADFKEFEPSNNKGIIIMNPPYGERIKPDHLENLYSDIGFVLKHKCEGYKAWIITSRKEFLHKIGLKPLAKKPLFNGSIECIYSGYEIYEGSRKIKNLG